MSQRTVLFTRNDEPSFHLRSISEDDLEDLRYWKNRNKSFFFLKTDITSEQQLSWYGHFLKRENDFMFIAEEEFRGESQKAGCMGFRLISDENTVDAYNIMRFEKTETMVHSMMDMFKTMLRYAMDLYPGYSISVKVLKNNPAINWYTKTGFRFVYEGDTFNYYELDTRSVSDIIIKQL